MKETNTNKFSAGQVLLAMLGGAAVGAVTSLLLAPKSGRETRDMINGYYKEGKDKVGRVPGAVKNAADSARRSFTDTLEH